MRQVEPPAGKAATAAEDDEDDAIDLFGSDDEEDKEAARLREERLRQYAEKKAGRPALVAKSSILLDVKPVSDPAPGLAVGSASWPGSAERRAACPLCPGGRGRGRGQGPVRGGGTPWGLQPPDPASPPLDLPVG